MDQRQNPAMETIVRSYSVIGPLAIGFVWALGAIQAAEAPSLLLTLSYDAQSLRSSRGGPLQNGCEGWDVMMKTGERLFASRCDPERLEKLGLHAKAAIQWNGREIEVRRIAYASGQATMIDYTAVKAQALYGATSNGVDAYLILNDKKEPTYYRAQGAEDKLRLLGFAVDALLAANDAADPKRRMRIDPQRINVVENKLDRSQALVGETAQGTATTCVIQAPHR